MNATKSKLIFHLIAIVTVIIWGTTFVSTKILIQNGLTRHCPEFCVNENRIQL